MAGIFAVIVFMFALVPAPTVIAGEEVTPKAIPKKLRIAVIEFENKVPNAQADIGWGMADMLISELKKRNQYTVLERASLADILGEQDFTNSERVQRGQQVKIGRIKGAQLLIKGGVTEFSYNVENRNLGLGYKGFGIGITRAKARVAVDIKLIDAMTGEIIHSIDQAKEIKSSGTSLAGTHKSFSFSTGGSDNHPLGQAVRELIGEVMGRITASLDTSTIEVLMTENFRGAIVKVDGPDRIVINRGASDGVTVGAKYDVSRITEELIDPETGEILGQEKIKLGRIEVTKVKDRYSITRSIYGEGFTRGDLVTK